MMFFFKRQLKPGLLTTRVEALSDSIFGFAITLLVLSITVPELTSAQLAGGELIIHIINLWPIFLAYLVSAFIIAIFWIGHTLLFHFINRCDRIFVWLNTFFIIMIAFFPFPVALVGRYHTDQTALIVYGATLFITGVFFAAMWLYATRGRRLINDKLTDALIRQGDMIILAAPFVYFAAILVSFVSIWVTILIYIFVPIFYAIPSAVDDIVEAAGED